MSRYLEIPVSGPLECIARRAHLAFKAIGRVQSYEPATGLSGIIRCDGGSAEVEVSWRPAGESFVLDIKANSAERLYQVADSALYVFASEYKEVTLAEREERDDVQGPSPWYQRLWKTVKR